MSFALPQHGGEDVSREQTPDYFDEAKTTLIELREQLVEYTGPFELSDPDEELRATVQPIVDNEVRHVPVR